jgi:hypothetical protein
MFGIQDLLILKKLSEPLSTIVFELFHNLWVFKYKRTEALGHKKRKEPSDMKLISYCFRLNSLSSHFVKIVKNIPESYWHFGE